MKNLVLIIKAHEGGPRMNASSDNQNQGQQGDLLSRETLHEILLIRISIIET